VKGARVDGADSLRARKVVRMKTILVCGYGPEISDAVARRFARALVSVDFG
jgi:hypothetical protein